MTGDVLLLSTFAALAVTAIGLQALAGVMRRRSLQLRRPEPLIDVTSTRGRTTRPPELDRLVNLVADALGSDRPADAHLRPLLDDLGELDDAAPERPSRARVDGRARRHWLDARVHELERVWSAGTRRR